MADPWGIADGYWDTGGRWWQTTPATRTALLAAMGADDHPAGPPPGPPMWFVRAGDSPPLQGPAELVLEDGTSIRSISALPPDLPLGYHELHPLDHGPPTRLVVTPGRCHLPPDLRTWGWAVQLYAARSRASWGIGDLGDLRALGAWAAGIGSHVLAINPLHAAAPTVPQQPSPYYPTSRRWRNPLYLRVEDVPGARAGGDGAAGSDLERLAAAGRKLNSGDRIDRDEVFRLKTAALGHLWERFRAAGGDRAFDQWRDGRSGALAEFATFCALAERHGPSFRAWPDEYHHPGSAGVARFAADNDHRLRYHEWLQWLLERQLAMAAADVGLVQDLAVGFDPDGADAWAWQDLLATPGTHVGAPPDDFNTGGQDWGLPPFVPWRLRHAGYQPFVETLQAMLHHAGGLRIDHVMGLFRLFWIPPEADATAGTYVRYPSADLLDILALESERAGAFVVGEDLGTVETEVRDELTARQVLSYRLFWFESGPPESWPEQALCAVTTHDLPTIAGVWTGADLDAQRRIGGGVNESGTAEMRRRLAAATGVDEAATADDVSVDEVVRATYRRLAAAPCRVAVATLDDPLGVEERPNMPGTVDEWPNWSIPLPVPIEHAMADDTVLGVADALRTTRE